MKLNQEWHIAVDDPLLGDVGRATLNELAQSVVEAYHSFPLESRPRSVIVNPLRYGLFLFLRLQDQGLPVSKKSFALPTSVTEKCYG